LIHGSVDIHGEARDVHLGKLGIGHRQGLPGEVASEFDAQDLVVTVAQIAHPAEQVSDVNQGDQGSRAVGDPKIVGCGDLAKFWRQLPVFGEQMATFAVRETKNFFLTHVERATCFRGALEALAEAGREQQ
jgi:hypothetical protein